MTTASALGFCSVLASFSVLAPYKPGSYAAHVHQVPRMGGQYVQVVQVYSIYPLYLIIFFYKESYRYDLHDLHTVF